MPSLNFSTTVSFGDHVRRSCWEFNEMKTLVLQSFKMLFLNANLHKHLENFAIWVNLLEEGLWFSLASSLSSLPGENLPCSFFFFLRGSLLILPSFGCI